MFLKVDGWPGWEELRGLIMENTKRSVEWEKERQQWSSSLIVQLIDRCTSRMVVVPALPVAIHLFDLFQFCKLTERQPRSKLQIWHRSARIWGPKWWLLNSIVIVGPKSRDALMFYLCCCAPLAPCFGFVIVFALNCGESKRREIRMRHRKNWGKNI